MSVFGSMASALSAVSDRAAEVDSQEKAAAAIEDRFVYDYPSTMLHAAVTAHLEFNRSNYRQTQSVVVVVRNRRTGKCAVFASQKEAGKCLGNIPPRFITEKILSGYCAKKDLQFVGVSSEADGVDFEDRVFQDPRRQSAHLLVTDIATGMRYLHQSIRSVSLRHDIDGTTVRRMIANRTGRNTKQRYKIEVEQGDTGYELLEKAGRKRGFLMRGAQVDTERMARILLDEFRAGKLGRFTLETVEGCEA